MISQGKREQAENRARTFHRRKNNLRSIRTGGEFFTGYLIPLALEYALGRRMEAALRERGEEGWLRYLETEGISREEAEEYMHFTAAVDSYGPQPEWRNWQVKGAFHVDKDRN